MEILKINGNIKKTISMAISILFEIAIEIEISFLFVHLCVINLLTT